MTEPAGPPDPAPFPPLATVRSERIYDSWWVGLRRDVLALPGGGEQEHHVVEIGDAVAIVAVTTDGRILLVGQRRHAHGKTHWEVPAGRLEDGEEPAAGAARELLEETGHAAASWTRLPGFYPINGISAHRAHAFVATGCERVAEMDLDPAEQITWRSFEPREVDALLRAGRLEDAFSALTLLYAQYLGHLPPA